MWLGFPEQISPPEPPSSSSAATATAAAGFDPSRVCYPEGGGFETTGL